MLEERRAGGQLIVATASILAILVGSVSLLTFIQSSERRITTMEVRIETLKDSIDLLRKDVSLSIKESRR